MFNKARKMREKAESRLDVIKLEADERKLMDKMRDEGSDVAKATVNVELCKVREKLRDARLVLKPRKSRPGNGTKRPRKGGSSGGVADFVGALFGGGK